MRLKIQPIQLSMALGVDPLTFNIIKYLSRAPYKNGVEDYKKALQYVEFLKFYKVRQRIHPRWLYYIDEYISVNGMPDAIKEVFYTILGEKYDLAHSLIVTLIVKQAA